VGGVLGPLIVRVREEVRPRDNVERGLSVAVVVVFVAVWLNLIRHFAQWL
jgi:hypothetical protein